MLKNKSLRALLMAILISLCASIGFVAAATPAQGSTCGSYCDRQPYPYQVVGCYQYAWDYANHYWRWMLICI